VRNNLKSKWHYANDDEYKDKESNVDWLVSVPHMSFSSLELKPEYINFKTCKVYFSEAVGCSCKNF